MLHAVGSEALRLRSTQGAGYGSVRNKTTRGYCMWVGFSKSLGGGFRVGVGTRLGSSSGRKSRGPTQAQIAKYEKAAFLKEMAEEANRLLQEFLVNHSIDPIYANKKKLDIDQLFKDSSAKKSYDLFVSSIKEIQEIINKVNYGGNLTGFRKDRLVDLVFNMRDIVERSGPGLNVVADQLSEKYKKISIVIFFTIFAILGGLVVIGNLIGSDASNGSGILSKIISVVLLSAIIYVPIHLI